MEKKYSSSEKTNCIEAVNGLPWNQLFYLNLAEEIHPFKEKYRFRPLEKAYDGNNTFWSTPSPEPDLSRGFWQSVENSMSDVTLLHGAARNLASSISKRYPDPEKILFVSILRAGVPITDWLCRLLPGSRGVALSLFVGIGIDRVALSSIEEDFPDRSIIFVDGWTGKGGVAREIAGHDKGPLAVLVDPWGWADFAGATDDIFSPSACFTGLATLGFSRTFVVDENECFSAYRFSSRFTESGIVRKWQSIAPSFEKAYPVNGKAKQVNAARHADFSDVLRGYGYQDGYAESFGDGDSGSCCDSACSPYRFRAETDLRVHSNEVCRALINAAPDTIYFSDDEITAEKRFPLILKLAEQRGVKSKFSQDHLKKLRTRVACSF